jgi:hypothetical protein
MRAVYWASSNGCASTQCVKLASTSRTTLIAANRGHSCRIASNRNSTGTHVEWRVNQRKDAAGDKAGANVAPHEHVFAVVHFESAAPRRGKLADNAFRSWRVVGDDHVLNLDLCGPPGAVSGTCSKPTTMRLRRFADCTFASTSCAKSPPKLTSQTRALL